MSSYHPQEILSRMRNEPQQNQQNQQNHQNQYNQQNQQKNSREQVVDKSVIDELFKKINNLESQVQNLEGNLSYANKEINVLRNQKEGLEDHVLKLEVENQHNQFDQEESRTGLDIVDAISREPVEKLLQRKEKNFNRFATKNTNQTKSKPAGHLKLEQLNSILAEYPNLARPIIHIKLTDVDFE